MQLTGGGVKAIKLRFHHDDWRTDMATVAAVRDAVGAEVELMVDANQGWRMPGDLTPRWDVETAAACARALEEYDVHWLEEPLPTDDPEAYRALGERTRDSAGGRRDGAHRRRGPRPRASAARSTCCSATCCSAAGSPAPAGWRSWPRSAAPRGRRTRGRTATGWSRTCTRRCAFSAYDYVEVPFDPPAWSAERRDWLLPAPVEIAADGTIAPPDGPGLGVEPDLDALERWRVA